MYVKTLLVLDQMIVLSGCVATCCQPGALGAGARVLFLRTCGCAAWRVLRCQPSRSGSVQCACACTRGRPGRAESRANYGNSWFVKKKKKEDTRAFGLWPDHLTA
jgi:hypothetical protein